MPQASPLSQIKDRFPDAVLDITEFANERILHIRGEHILTVLSGLKADGCNFLADITAIDNLTLGGFERLSLIHI